MARFSTQSCFPSIQISLDAGPIRSLLHRCRFWNVASSCPELGALRPARLSVGMGPMYTWQLTAREPARRQAVTSVAAVVATHFLQEQSGVRAAGGRFRAYGLCNEGVDPRLGA